MDGPVDRWVLAPGGIDPRLLQPPVSGMELRALGLDSPLETVEIVELENGHAGKLNALLAAGLSVDDGLLAVLGALAYPETAAEVVEAARPTEQLGLESGRMLAQRRRQRIIEPGRDDALQQPDDDRRPDELPGRDSGRARDNQFEAARQVEVAHHAGGHHRERQHTFGQMRDAIQRNLRDEEGRDILHVRRAPHHLDEIDHRDDHQHARKNDQDGAEEAPAEIARERAGHHHCADPVATAVRRATPSTNALTALVINAGGSMMMPRAIAQIPRTNVAASAR